jgi:hypothetical protein
LHQPPWSTGSSQVPAPPWVGSRSPDDWDQIPRCAGGWACTSHPGVLGSIPKREEPGKTGRHPVQSTGLLTGPSPALGGFLTGPISRCIGFPMSAHLSRLRLFQRHLHSFCWDWVWVWDWLTLLLARSFTRSSSSCHPPLSQYLVPSRSLVRYGQTSPHMPRLVLPHSTCPSLSPSPPRTQPYNRSCSKKHNHALAVRSWSFLRAPSSKAA